MVKETENRKCVITGEIKPKSELLRFVLLKDGTVIPDFNKKIAGHGFYISNSKTLLEKLAAKPNALNKILHTKTVITEDFAGTVERILLNKSLEAVNLARKAGDLVQGFEKVKDVINKGKAAFVIEASDAGDDGKQKMASIAGDLERISIYDIATLSQTLKRDNTVYLAVKKGPICKMVLQALKRYRTFLDE